MAAQRYRSGKLVRVYWTCGLPGCGTRIRRDGAAASRRIAEHKATHGWPRKAA